MEMRQLPYPRHLGLKHIQNVELWQDLHIEQWTIAKGTIIKTFQTRDFGWVLLPFGTKDKAGFEIPKHIFKW